MEKFMQKIKEYGIEEGLIPFAHDLEILKELSPEKYKHATTDPPEIEKDIIKYDFYIDTGIDTGYMRGRRWDLFMALREIIQNALDAQEAANRPIDEIKIYTRKNILHIRDYGCGIKLRHFRVGATDKVCWHRGYYGEGMKISALYFLINNIGFYVFTGNKVYKLTLFDNKHMAIIVGFSKRNIKGTDVVLYFDGMTQMNLLKQSVDNLNNITFQQYLKKIKKYNPKIIEVDLKGTRSQYELYRNCDHIRKVTIVTPDNLPEKYQGLLFIGDIYVGKIKSATGFDSKMTYNLWFVELEPNRKQVKDRDKFSNIVFELVGESDEFTEYIIYNLFKLNYINVSGHLLPLVIKPEHVLETGAQSYAHYIHRLTSLLEKRFGDMKICYVRGIEIDSLQAYAYQTSLKYRFLTLYTPYLESNYSVHFDSISEVLEKIFAEDQIKNNTGDIKVDNLKISYAYVLSVLNAMKDFMFTYGMSKSSFNRSRVPIVKINKKLDEDTLGTYNPRENVIRINYNVFKKIDKLNIAYNAIKVITGIYEEPFFEEISHAYGYKILGKKAADISRALEEAMSMIAGLTFRLTTTHKEYLNMAMLGLYYDSVINERFYTTENMQEIFYGIEVPYESLHDFILYNNNPKFTIKNVLDEIYYLPVYPLMTFVTIETLDDIKEGGEKHERNKQNFATFRNKYNIVSFKPTIIRLDIDENIFIKTIKTNVFKYALLHHIDNILETKVEKYIGKLKEEKVFVSYITIFYDFNETYYIIHTSIKYDKLQEINNQIKRLRKQIEQSYPETNIRYLEHYIDDLDGIVRDFGITSYFEWCKNRFTPFEIDFKVYIALYRRIKEIENIR